MQLTDPKTQLALYFVTLAILAVAFYVLRYVIQSRFWAASACDSRR
jgi:hypothetical protein